MDYLKTLTVEQRRAAFTYLFVSTITALNEERRKTNPEILLIEDVFHFLPAMRKDFYTTMADYTADIDAAYDVVLEKIRGVYGDAIVQLIREQS